MTRLLFAVLFFPIIMTQVSCQLKSPKAICYYSDGTAINDQVHLRLLKRKLPKLLKKLDIQQHDLKVYTSLQSNVNSSLDQSVVKLQDHIYPQINWQHREEKAFMDSLRKEQQMLEVGVVVIDNRTGRILVNYSNRNPAEQDVCSRRKNIGGLNKTFLYALSMQEEFGPNSFYPQLKRTYADSGPQFEPDSTFYRSMKQCFGMSFGTIPRGLDERYTLKQAIAFAKQLELDPGKMQHGPWLFDLHLSLTDLTKTWAMFCKDGYLHQPTIIDSITDSKGKLLYKRVDRETRVLDWQTADDVARLLDFYTLAGMGAGAKRRFPDLPDYFGNFAKSTTFDNGSGYFMASYNGYTIGVYSGLALRHLRLKHISPANCQDMTVPIWLTAQKRIEAEHPSMVKYILEHPIRPLAFGPETNIGNEESSERGSRSRSGDKIRGDIQLR